MKNMSKMTETAFPVDMAGDGEINNETLTLISEARPHVALSPAECPRIKLPEEALQTATRLKMALSLGEQIIAVTGIDKTDGAGRLAVQMGLAMADIEQGPVLIVDANIKGPQMHSMFKTPQSPGLFELIEAETDRYPAIRPTDNPNVFVLPLGNQPSLAISMFTSPKCLNVLEIFRRNYRYIFVDVGLVLHSPEGMVLASQTDGIVVALASGERRRHEVLQLTRELDGLKTRLLGVVLTEKK